MTGCYIKPQVGIPSSETLQMVVCTETVMKAQRMEVCMGTVQGLEVCMEEVQRIVVCMEVVERQEV